jgi:hypothetical protein
MYLSLKTFIYIVLILGDKNNADGFEGDPHPPRRQQ